MTAEIIFASNNLGVIHDSQLQMMLDKFNLGKIISSRKTSNGAMGLTMFVHSTEGEFVFKGNPLYSGQFVEEKFYIESIHRKTNIRVPLPYIIDDSDDIFGWNYSLMPCLQGEHLHSDHLKSRLNMEEKNQIAEEIAKTLAELHSWKVNDCGELDTKNLEIIPFKESYTSWLYQRIKFWLEDAKKYSIITDEDETWVEKLLKSSKDTFETFSTPTFIMGDFKPENFLINYEDNGWEISGVFDFTNAYFGDPLSDLIKIITFYLDNDEQDIAKNILKVYFPNTGEKEALKKRLNIHMLHQRVLDWGCAKAMNQVTWDATLSFSDWAKSYTDSVMELWD